MGQLLGPNFLQFLLLALAGALVVGNVLALVRPPASRGQAPGRSATPGRGASEGQGRGSGRGRGDLERAPLVRSAVMIALGLIVVVWTLATLIS
jgi:hypothetical protein